MIELFTIPLLYVAFAYIVEISILVYGQISPKYEKIDEVGRLYYPLTLIIWIPVAPFTFPLRIIKFGTIKPWKMVPHDPVQQSTSKTTNRSNRRKEIDVSFEESDESLKEDDTIIMSVEGDMIAIEGHMTDEDAARMVERMVELLKERNT